jgi:hypothetical protein
MSFQDQIDPTASASSFIAGNYTFWTIIPAGQASSYQVVDVPTVNSFPSGLPGLDNDTFDDTKSYQLSAGNTQIWAVDNRTGVASELAEGAVSISSVQDEYVQITTTPAQSYMYYYLVGSGTWGGDSTYGYYTASYITDQYDYNVGATENAAFRRTSDLQLVTTASGNSIGADVVTGEIFRSVYSGYNHTHHSEIKASDTDDAVTTNTSENTYHTDTSVAGTLAILKINPATQATTINLREDRSGNITTVAQTGSINYTDTVAGTASAAIQSQTVTAVDGAGHTVILSSAQITALEAAFHIGAITGDGSAGSINWSYDPHGTSLNFLTSGETIAINTTVQVTDQGISQTASVAVGLTGPAGAAAGFDTRNFPGLPTTAWLANNTNLQWVDYYLTPAPDQSNALGWMGNRVALQNQGWRLAPIFVGRQTDLDPAMAALDPNTDLPIHNLIENHLPAANQGKKDADKARDLLQSEGFSPGTTVYLDIESAGQYVNGDADLKTYIQNWCAEIGSDGYGAGVYCPKTAASIISSLVPGARLMVASTGQSTSLMANIDATTATGAPLAGYLFPEADPSRSGASTATSWQYILDQFLTLPTSVYANQFLQLDLTTTRTTPIAGDILNSGTASVTWANPSTGEVGVWTTASATASWTGIGVGSTTMLVAGIGDFTGNGTSDILWQNPTNNLVGAWLMNNGQPTWQLIDQGSTTMNVAGIGDFYGNGTDDILWQNPTNNLVGMWQMNSGRDTWQLVGQGSTTMNVAGVGDFNGDGTSDILWENPTNNLVGMWGMNGSSLTWSLIDQGSTSMKIVGMGDFTGSGTDDILWENPSNGVVGFWGMSNGQDTSWNVVGTASTSYQVADIGDYYGNGTDDILWRDGTTGDTGIWAMNDGQATWRDLGISSTSFNTVKA